MNSAPVAPNGLRPLVSVRYLGSILGLPPATLRHIARHADRYYHSFLINRPGRSKPREIDPAWGILEKIQDRIKRRILDRFKFPGFVHGGVRGRSTTSNARPHVGQPKVVKADIHSFYGTATAGAVARAWKEHFGCGRETTWLLTRLTTYKGHLPQGTHTSPDLANLVILPAAERICAAAQDRGLGFTIFVDDITVSGADAELMIDFIAREIGRLGFSLSRKKTQVMPRGALQVVTGNAVNRKISNGAAKVRSFRRELLKIFRTGDSHARARLNGKVAHATSVCPSQGRSLRRLLASLARDSAEPTMNINGANQIRAAHSAVSGPMFPAGSAGLSRQT